MFTEHLLCSKCYASAEKRGEMLNQYLLRTTECPAQDNGQVQLGFSLLGKAVMEKFLTLKELSMPLYKVTRFMDPM